MNAKELAEKLAVNPSNTGDLALACATNLPIILRALRLLAAAEAGDGETPETDGATFIVPVYVVEGLREVVSADRAKALERQRNGLAAECERMREDAERYRWLRGKARAEGRDGGNSGLYSLPHIPAWDTNIHNALKQRGYHYATLDAAIDAARGKE